MCLGYVVGAYVWAGLTVLVMAPCRDKDQEEKVHTHGGMNKVIRTRLTKMLFMHY